MLVRSRYPFPGDGVYVPRMGSEFADRHIQVQEGKAAISGTNVPPQTQGLLRFYRQHVSLEAMRNPNRNPHQVFNNHLCCSQDRQSFPLIDHKNQSNL